MGNKGKGPGKRCVGTSHKQGKKPCKQHLRKKFENRHIDQVWDDIRKPPTMVHVPGKTGPIGTTAK
jgi:bud site selection protein 20